jgi:hypothetical protein
MHYVGERLKVRDGRAVDPGGVFEVPFSFPFFAQGLDDLRVVFDLADRVFDVLLRNELETVDHRMVLKDGSARLEGTVHVIVPEFEGKINVAAREFSGDSFRRRLIGAPHIPPREGDAWRMNLYRIDSPEPGRQKFCAWNPTQKIDFHRPWRFGLLMFQ